MSEDYVLLAGSASTDLATAVGEYLEHNVGRGETLRFSDGNLFVRVLENVRGRDVFVVQAVAPPANDNFMELLFWIDALKRASASSVTAVEIVSVAGLFGEAIKRIHQRESISVLFE